MNKADEKAKADQEAYEKEQEKKGISVHLPRASETAPPEKEPKK